MPIQTPNVVFLCFLILCFVQIILSYFFVFSSYFPKRAAGIRGFWKLEKDWSSNRFLRLLTGSFLCLL
uniref:Uncharacterized protein n=1 Tax=Arundo donax TaxID=35708 RepID=A0A0A9BHL6_ARUDO